MPQASKAATANAFPGSRSGWLSGEPTVWTAFYSTELCVIRTSLMARLQ